jgi:membrane-bound serine protease (ClpP class)
MIWLGIVLIILAFGLIVGEFFTGSGLLLVSGIVALVFGLVILFTLGSMSIQIDWWLATLFIILFVSLITFVVWRVVKIHHQKAKTGSEDMEGNTAVVKKTIDPEGIILFEGELWNAISSSGKIETGVEVIITKVDRLMLTVAKKEKQ